MSNMGNCFPLKRFHAGLLTFLLLLTSSPLAPVSAADFSMGKKVLTEPPHPAKVRIGPKSVNLVEPTFKLTDDPSDSEISNAFILPSGLIALHSKPVSGENQALAKALLAYSAQGDRFNAAPLKQFLQDYPTSRWTPAVQLNVGLLRYECGYYSEALADWRLAWDSAKSETERDQKALANGAIAQLLRLEARLGRTEELEPDLNSINKRGFYGSDEAIVRSAKISLHCEKNKPEVAFKCGPFAVNSLLGLNSKSPSRNPIIEKFHSTKKGTNLSQVRSLAEQVGLHYQIAKRSPGATIIVPAVVHFKVGHFAAVTAKHGGKYQIKDPTFGDSGNLWAAPEVVDAESDGYFLVPTGALPTGWISVSETEAQTVWGRGYYAPGGDGSTPSSPREHPGKKGDGGCSSGNCDCDKGASPMAQAAVFSVGTNLNIYDTPVGYSPPVGPSIQFRVNYTYMEGNQPGPPGYTFPNFGSDWSVNWISYLTLDPSKNATVRVRGGGYEIYDYSIPDNLSNPYPPNLTSQAVLTLVSVGVYKRLLPDGTVEVFSQPDGNGRIFLTQIIDPQGNPASIQYAQYGSYWRISSITDAIGQVSTITYLSNNNMLPTCVMISQITDAFGRSAYFTYDASNTYLTSIKDVINLVSQFTYDTDSSSFINSMTTPYGTTSFRQYSYNIAGEDLAIVGLQFAFPDGSGSVIESWTGVNGATYYWDREALMQFPLDPANQFHANCKTTQWMLSGSAAPYAQVPVPQSVSPVLGGPFQYTYAGETPLSEPYGSALAGPSNRPTQVQIGTYPIETYQYQYNVFGKVTQSIDPVGRTFTYRYAANNIDLLETRQTQSGANDLNGKWEYNNNKHRPNVYIDGSGQKTQMTYNTFGELLTLTDANGNVWTRTYNLQGYLVKIQGPLAGSLDVTTFSYDVYGRLLTVTDSEGYTLSYSYDSADRPTQTLYPDGTTERTIYDKLDAVMTMDRNGRWTQFAYTPMDDLSYVMDPLGRKTLYSWCACGGLSALTDPAGNITNYQRDLLGRLTKKIYPDGSSLSYTYDGFSNVIFRNDALGQETQYNYNSDNTLKSVIYNTQTVLYTWDLNYLRLATVSNWFGAIHYSYNPFIIDPFAPIHFWLGGYPAPNGVPVAGDIINVTVSASSFNRNVQYTVNATHDTSMAALASNINTAINGDPTLSANGITSSLNGNMFSLTAPNSLGTVTAKLSANGILTEMIGGSPTNGDTVSITVADAGLPSGPVTISHPVTGSDTPLSIAAALTSSINGNGSLAGVGVTACASEQTRGGTRNSKMIC